jgi:catechol 2,3-dioxygenase-like lactoylglutathione lyase family enzyme
VDWKLELVVVPVSDVDRAKDFYIEKAGFHLDVDHSSGEDFRVVQLTPPGSACSITLMRNAEVPGSVRGLHLVVPDIEAARAELAGRGMEIGEIFHFEAGQQMPGPDPARQVQLVPRVQRPRRHRMAGPGGPATRARQLADGPGTGSHPAGRGCQATG